MESFHVNYFSVKKYLNWSEFLVFKLVTDEDIFFFKIPNQLIIYFCKNVMLLKNLALQKKEVKIRRLKWSEREYKAWRKNVKRERKEGPLVEGSVLVSFIHGGAAAADHRGIDSVSGRVLDDETSRQYVTFPVVTMNVYPLISSSSSSWSSSSQSISSLHSSRWWLASRFYPDIDI